MSLRGATSLGLTALVLAAPAAAFADGGGAGDQQYQDPLTAPATPKKATKKVAAAPVASAPSAPAAPAAAAPAPVASAPASTSASSRELPRTGAPAGLIGLSGATLVLSGAALRRRTAPR